METSKPKMKRGARIVLVTIAAFVIVGGWQLVKDTAVIGKIEGLFLKPAAQVAKEIDLQGVKGDVGSAGGGQVTSISSLPARTPASVGNQCQLRFLTIPWSGMNAIMAANGGAETTKGSLMEQAGLRIKIERKDSYTEMMEQLFKFASEFSEGSDCPTSGAALVGIMGDGGPGFANGLQPQLTKLGMGMEVIGAVGFSNGEDKCFMPYEVATDPQKARGVLIAGVNGDGDINLCLVFAAANKIPVNFDATTYDADAINFSYTSSFNEADEKYIAGATEERDEVKKGKLTGKKVKVTVNGTATWTPGDVNVAKKKGGVAAVASTRDFNLQMAATVIGIKQYFEKHPEVPTQFLRASLLAGSQIQRDAEWLKRAAEINVDVYGEQDVAYWTRYFKGVTEMDAQGKPISLGGSRTINANQARQYYGLNAGGTDTYKRVWDTFAKIYSAAFPADYSTIPPYADVVNTSYLAKATEGAKAGEGDAPKFNPGQSVDRVVGKRSWTIEFDTGKASFRPDAYPVLDELLSQLSFSNNLVVQINGYTDNVGDDESNFELSKRRAQAVVDWLKKKAPESFPEGRLRSRGYGEASPTASNDTAEGRQTNRRVEVVLGATGE